MAGRKKRGQKKQSNQRKETTTRAQENIVPTVEEHVEELSEGNSSDDLSAPSEESQPLPPCDLYFKNTEFTKTCKIQSKCYVTDTVKVIKNLEDELPWFERHSQFSHFFHMPQEDNLRLLGMWMLLLRTIPLGEEEDTAWFAVNGVPIRYSIREHALISGLDCRDYPPNYKKLGSFEFVDRHFREHKEITMLSVKEKLLSMRSCGDRLKMAVLYFLGTIIRGNGKYNGPIDPFILRVVNDLEACETFPWGRLTFEDAIRSINKVMKHLKGSPKSSVNFPGFIVPLEVLVFECIPAMNAKFREPVPGCMSNCPRMCKKQFQSNSMRGYPLQELYETLGETKAISSFLLPTLDEETLMARIVEEEPEYDKEDGASNQWSAWLTIKGKPIWWKELYELDVAAREFPKKKNKEKVFEKASSSSDGLENVLENVLTRFEERVMVSLTEVNVKMETMEKRLDGIEKSQRVLKEKAKKTGAMEKRLNATEKSQSVMKRKIVKMAWKLKGMKEYAVEKGQDDMGFDNLDMGFYNQYSNRKGAEEKEEEQARTKDAEMVAATQDQETQVQKEVEEEVQEEVQEEEEEEEVEEEIIEARFGEAEKDPEEAEKDPEEAEKEPEEAEKEREKAEKEPEDEECMNYTEEEKARWILTIFKSFDGIFPFSRARFVDGTSGTPPAQMDGTPPAQMDGTPPAQMDGTPPAQTDGTPPALVVTPPTPGTPIRGRTKAMASKKGGVSSPATGRKKPLNPQKFTTPPPEKRVRVPSQWLSSPFMEVNTEEIEGPKKKPKTKP